MSEVSDRVVVFLAPNAPEDGEARGLVAAMRVFQRTGLDPADCHDALIRVDEESDLLPVTEAQRRQAAVWMTAQQAAIEACYAGAPVTTFGAALEIRWLADMTGIASPQREAETVH